MVKRIIAIAFIFVCTAVAWAILGGTIFSRTYESRSRLQGRVESTWGAPHVQKPPAASYTESETRTVESVEDGRKVVRTAQVRTVKALPLESSRVQAGLELDYRRKGLLWYSTYKVAFSGLYVFRNATDADRDVTFNLEFPAARAIYDNLVFTVDGRPVALASSESGASAVARVGAGKTAPLAVAYRSQGLESWRYNFGGAVSQVKDFNLRITTNFKRIDFPDDTLSPSEKRETAAGWELVWNYKNLVSGFQIGLKMPERLQPGPVAGKISLFAPVSLFFFFFLMLIITTMRGIELHPMNYFFLAAAFFSFHLLVAYLVDHISIHAAFAVSSAVSILLV
ncbi:MAG: hypothetical protein EHM65_08675, partial [Acidobacteriales bacterium]